MDTEISIIIPDTETKSWRIYKIKPTPEQWVEVYALIEGVESTELTADEVRRAMGF